MVHLDCSAAKHAQSDQPAPCDSCCRLCPHRCSIPAKVTLAPFQAAQNCGNYGLPASISSTPEAPIAPVMRKGPTGYHIAGEASVAVGPLSAITDGNFCIAHRHGSAC